MSKMKSLGLMMGLAVMGIMAGQTAPHGMRREETLSEEERKRKRKQAEEKIKKANDLTEYFYGNGLSVWARNQKNADRKAKNNGWI